MVSPETSPIENDRHTLIVRTGYILWTLRDSLRQLGIDQTITDVSRNLPEVHDRLLHVVALMSDASCCVLNSVEQAQPLQNMSSDGASRLSNRWSEWYQSHSSNMEAHILTLDSGLSWPLFR